MKRSLLTLLILSSLSCVIKAQVPHLYEHTFPNITQPKPIVQQMLGDMDVNQLKNDVDHLCSYINRRADGPYIYNVKDWIVEQYKSLGFDSIYLHEFEPYPYWDTVPRPFNTAPNVLIVQPGVTKPNEVVICGGHYDSTIRTEGDFDVDTLRAPGADDNASGTAGILSVARVLGNYKFDRTIIYASWNAEEFGLCGSHAFAKKCAADSLDIVAYTNLDMTGYVKHGNEMVINLLYTNCDSLLGKFMKQIVNAYYPEIRVWQSWLSSGDTDFSSFNRNGYQAISLSEEVYNMSPYIHTINDVVGVSLNNYDNAMIFNGVTLAAVAEMAGIVGLSVENNLDDDFELYPNPVSDMLHVEGKFMSFEVFDVMGRKVLNSSNENEIYVNNWNTGIYIIRFINSDGKVFTKKFLVKS